MLNALARTFSGKISPVTTHATGPQELAKKKMYRHTKAMAVRCAGRLVVPAVVPTMATMYWQIVIPVAP